MPKPPNLLLIWTDEQRADTMACYGNTHIQAPNLNRLAELSFVFSNAYCSQPLCTPSRASVLTGMWPHTHGCIANNTPLDAQVHTIAEMVDGYRCAYYGKWHLGDELLPQHGFEERVGIEDGIYRPYYSRPELLEQRSDYHHYLVNLGFAPDVVAPDGARVFSRDFAAALSEKYTKSAFLGRETARFLREQNNNSDPFLLSVNFLEPHMPFFGPLNDLYAPESLPVGPAFCLEPESSSDRNLSIAARYAAKGIGNYPLQTEAQWRRLRANYYGQVTLVDRAIGEILDALKATGQADNTIVVFTSDHGDMMGDHALIAKGVLYEEVVKIPLLISVPWLSAGAKSIDGRVSQVDLVPTLLDLMAQPIPESVQGVSRADTLRGGGSLETNDVFIEWSAGDKSNQEAPQGFTAQQVARISRAQWRTIVAAQGWKMNLCDDDRCELYNLELDPHEFKIATKTPTAGLPSQI